MAWLRAICWNLPEILGGCLLVAITALVGLAVISRYVFYFGLTWAEELVRFMFIWVAFLSGALAVKHLGHFRLTLVRDALPPAVAHVLDVLGHLSFVALGGVFCVYGYEISVLTSEQTSPALGISQGVVYASLALSGLLMMLYGIVNTYKEVTGQMGR